MYYALVDLSGKRIDFSNKYELHYWIAQQSSLLNHENTLSWYLYHTKKCPVKFCNRTLSSRICSLNYYMSKNKLFDYGKKEKNPHCGSTRRRQPPRAVSTLP